jgi:hypothetical protein
MNSLAWLCLAACAVAGCHQGAKPGSSARTEAPLEILGYRLGMSEEAVQGHGDASCHNLPGKLDADRICNASAIVSGQPALLFFYFYHDSLAKLTLTILPRHGQLEEVSRSFSREFETKYGKPASDNTLAVTWAHGGGAIVINRGDERTMTVNLVSGDYENEKARRAKNDGRGIEV